MGILPSIWRSVQSGSHTWDGLDRSGGVDTRWAGVHLPDPGFDDSGGCGASDISWTYECVDNAWRWYFGCSGLV